MANPLKRPPIWFWQMGYCFFLSFVYLLVAVGGVAIIIVGKPMLGMNSQDAIVIGAVCIVVGGFLHLLSAAPPFFPLRPWSWKYGLMLIVFGLAGGITLPFAAVLLHFWLKPQTKRHFGMMP